MFLSALIMGVFLVYFQPAAVKRSRVRDAAKLDAIAARMLNCPREIGNWQSEHAPIGENEFSLSNLVAHDRRIFRNKSTGEEVLIYVVLGTARHVAIHSPDFSYRYSGFAIVDGPTNHHADINGTAAEFMTTSLAKGMPAVQEQVRMVWSY